jgi:arsenate reductase (thioredoxin)
MKILIICDDNAIRSQMAEGFLKSFDPKSEVFSAGTAPASQIHPYTVEVMKEAYINQTENSPSHYKSFLHESFDCIIGMCEETKAIMSEFEGKSLNMIQFDFQNPKIVIGNDEENLTLFRIVRDEIKNEIFNFFKHKIR